MKAPLGPRQEELLSYFQGLAPVGDMFEFRWAEVAADLGFRVDAVLYQALRKLVRKGFVERVHAGQSDMKGRLKVLRRLESVRSERVGPRSPAAGDTPDDAGVVDFRRSFEPSPPSAPERGASPAALGLERHQRRRRSSWKCIHNFPECSVMEPSSKATASRSNKRMRPR